MAECAGMCAQDTIKSPGETKKMKKATLFGIGTTTFFYACIGIIGYAAFGNAAPGNLLSGCVCNHVGDGVIYQKDSLRIL